MVGWNKIMKIYVAYNKTADSVEVILNQQELKELVDGLVKFETRIKQFKVKNAGKEKLGFTHLHYKDCCSLGKHSKEDIVFYVDMDK